MTRKPIIFGKIGDFSANKYLHEFLGKVFSLSLLHIYFIEIKILIGLAI